MLTGEAELLSCAKLMFYYHFKESDNIEDFIYQNIIYKPTCIKDYYISENGQVLSLKQKEPYLMQSHICHFGHHRIELKTENGAKKYFIHRLVYESWVGPLEEDKVVEHLDSNPANNHYTNLKLSTQQENIQTCIKQKRRVGNIQSKILFNTNENLFYKFNSVQDLLLFFNLKGDSINKFKKSKSRIEIWKIIDNKTLEGQSTIETIDFSEVKSKNGVEYFVGAIPTKEVHGN